jgi:hypothetical protein
MIFSFSFVLCASPTLFLVGFISSLPQLAWDKRLSCCGGGVANVGGSSQVKYVLPTVTLM